MTITIERYIECTNKAHFQSITCSFDLLIYLLGDYLTYNELCSYSKSEFIDLAIGTKVFEDNILTITIWINEKFIKDIQVKNNGNDLIYKLEQIEDEEGISVIETKGKN